MPDEPTDTADGTAEPELNELELAHSIIEALLEHTSVVSDLIALMAQALDPENRIKPERPAIHEITLSKTKRILFRVVSCDCVERFCGFCFKNPIQTCLASMYPGC